MGWDHGNNQNLYTFGGAGIRQGGINALGKIVGSTERFGSSGENRQFTRPTSSSYEAEPMSIASSVYSYFGVTNPEVLTADDQMNPGGDAPIDENQAVTAPAPVAVAQTDVSIPKSLQMSQRCRSPLSKRAYLFIHGYGIHQYLTSWALRNVMASLPCSMAKVDNIPASIQLLLITVTDLGASGTG